MTELNKTKICSICHGYGTIKKYNSYYLNIFFNDEQCYNCNGTGIVND
jgi:DnaJ-class molecular chaperone